MINLDDLAFTAPACPDCGVVLRDDVGVLRCPQCAFTIDLEDTATPTSFIGPDLDDWR